jgi:fatty acid kinase fatty acid binding subunit
MSIKIVTDSACDLPEAIAVEHGIAVVPLYVNVGDKSYLDGAEMSRHEFYERLPHFPIAPTTSAPSPGQFVETYEGLAAKGATAIVSVHIAASLSNTVNVAQIAAQATQAVPVTVVDGGQLSLGTGLLTIAAAQAAAAGADSARIVALVNKMSARTYTFAALDTLEFIRRSGRMSRFAYSLGTLLNIKPLLKMHSGQPSMERIRTRRRAIQRLIQLVSELGPLEDLALVHSHAPNEVEALLRQARQLFPHGDVPFCVEVTPVLGAHIGPGALGFVAVQKR